MVTSSATLETKTLIPDSQKYWSDKTDAKHRYSTEKWLQIYSSELLALLPQGGTLLDVGCGACQITTYLAPAFERVYAIDFSDSMLETARQRIKNLQITNISLLF